MNKCKRLQKMMKRVTAAMMVACVMVSGFTTTINSEASSKKQTIYVVSKITYGKGTTALKYNKNGLISEIKDAEYNSKFNYTYNKKVLKKTRYSNIKKEIKEGRDITRNDEYKISRNKKGKIKKVKSNGYPDFEGYSFKYDNKNRVIYLGFQRGGVYTNECKYDKKGRIDTVITSNYMGGTGPAMVYTYKYTYDEKGYVNSKYEKSHTNIGYEDEETTEETTTYKNTYKNGRLVKRNDIKISYKKVSVTKSYKKYIENQQRKIIEYCTAGCGLAGTYYWGLSYDISVKMFPANLCRGVFFIG